MNRMFVIVETKNNRVDSCHKKTASGVYSQEAQLRKQAFDDLGGGTRNRDRAQGKCHREF